MQGLNARYANLMTSERRKEMERRYIKELVEFLSPCMQVRDGSEKEEQGRTSGSEEWKRLRGELGVQKSGTVIIKSTEEELLQKYFRHIIHYSSHTEKNTATEFVALRFNFFTTYLRQS